VAKIEITRTELVWPGKYDEQGNRVVPPRANLPFQVIETINESRATREARKRPEQGTLFDVWSGSEGDTFEEGWRNKLIWGDNLLVMSSLLARMAGKIDLIYIDPPFATGADFSVKTTIGESGEDAIKAPSSLEEKAYRDTWGRGTASYLQMMSERLTLMKLLLAPAGSLLVHVDYRMASHLRLVLEEIFGSQLLMNEIVWNKGFRGTRSNRIFQHAHDTIWWFANGEDYRWTQTFEPYKDQDLGRYNQVDQEGKRYALIKRRRTDGSVYYGRTYPGEDGKWRNDVISDVATMAATDSQRTGYETQKPERLLAVFVEALSEPGDIVADFFAGSGTTAAVAEKLGRRWIVCDLSRFAIHTTRKRLMAVEGCKPFEVLNLGRYERQYWQAASFSGRDPGQVIFEYLAFILRLYGAMPVVGLQYLHGKKGSAVVHVGAVDAPVTIDEVTQALDECVATGQQELHVLGWEWEMGLNDLVDQLAADRRVRLKLLAIPREVMEAQAVEKHDIRFFELAHLAAEFAPVGQKTVTARLTNFAMSGAEGIAPEILARIEKWSDLVDYWAVDWDFRNDTFMNGWVAYRTRKERRLPLQTDPHTYDAPGSYTVAVKVVDIFGNDTTRVFPLEVR
jgi:adenine-specific DNA-methyltransferase